jgi:hypothetical protein
VLTAVDGGSPESSRTAQINITVIDANDNTPVSHQSLYRVKLVENAPKDTVVIKLNASDLDEGPNTEITYAFSGHAPSGCALYGSGDIIDVNDNLPEVILTSVSTPVQEDGPPGTVIAVISVMDKENGNLDCEIPDHVPAPLLF